MQKHRKMLLVGMLLSMTSLSHAQAVGPDTIPFQIGADKRIYVNATINGFQNHPLRFLVDTGASDVVLNAALPEVMEKAEFTNRVTNQGPTSVEVIPGTSPDQKLKIGKSEVQKMSFIAIAYPPEAWDGVLGLSFLRHFDVMFNYDRKEMYLYPQGEAPKLKQAAAIAFDYKEAVPTIPVIISINDHRYQIQAELDTGSDRILDLNTPYVKRHQLRGTLPVFAVSTISGTSGQQGQLENVCFDFAKIGSTTFPRLPGAFSTLTTGLQSTESFDGVIGNNLLQRFNQLWDFKNKVLYVVPNHRYYTPFYDFLVQ